VHVTERRKEKGKYTNATQTNRERERRAIHKEREKKKGRKKGVTQREGKWEKGDIHR
jgi:hypothetical protein